MLNGYAVAFLAAIDSIGDIKLNATVLAILIGTVIPIIAGRLTKARTRWTGILNIFLNAVNAVLVTSVVTDGVAVFSATTLLNGLLSATAASIAYYAAWAPNGITNNPAANPQGKALLGPDTGLG